MARKRGLGRGLDALLSTETGQPAQTQQGLRELAVGKLHSGAHQPRQHFDEASLDALADSIRAQGIVEPLIVRPSEKGYEIVAGERRWRAAKRAGLKHVPVMVREFDERTAMAVALVENIQRADLNPLEEAEALKRLIDECKLTHEQTAQAVGRSRAGVSNLLRLMDLPDSVQTCLRDGRLSLGHAKVLLGAANERREAIARKVVALGLSVRQTENLVKRADASSGKKKQTAVDYTDSVRELQQALGTKVRIKSGGGGAGSVVIPFRNRKALEALVGKLSGE